MEDILIPRADTASTDAVASSSKSAASWAAIIAGAVVAIAASLILLALGSGLGFAAVSPWADHGVSVTTFTVLFGPFCLMPLAQPERQPNPRPYRNSTSTEEMEHEHFFAGQIRS